jgi:hypothetical protein
MATKTIDLRTCVSGQPLLSGHGEILTYVRPLPPNEYYDHVVMYKNGSLGTRTHEGYVYRNPASRLPVDHDIVEILPID